MGHVFRIVGVVIQGMSSVWDIVTPKSVLVQLEIQGVQENSMLIQSQHAER